MPITSRVFQYTQDFNKAANGVKKLIAYALGSQLENFKL